MWVGPTATTHLALEDMLRTEFIEVDGVRMRWEEQGEGTPVTYVHGIPTSPRLWRHVIPQVDNARSLAWEMAG